MKRTAIVLIMMLGLSIPKVFSQDIKYEIKVNYNDNQLPPTAKIIIEVTAGTPEFTYFLMTNHPLNGTILQQSEPTKKRNYVFRDVKPGIYFLKIQDKTGMMAGKTVNVLENQM